MGLFFKKRKFNPKISTQGIEVEFSLDYGSWTFVYREKKFLTFEHFLQLPSMADLDDVLKAVESLKPEMRTRLTKEFSEYSEVKLDDGETFTVDVSSYVTDKKVVVSWSEGVSWGDMGVDFTIKGQEIIDESWGD